MNFSECMFMSNARSLGNKSHTLFVGEANNLNGEVQPFPFGVEHFDTGNCCDDTKHAVVFARVHNRIQVGSENEGGAMGFLAFVPADQIADGVNEDGHAGIGHPPRHQVVGAPVLRRQVTPRQTFAGLADLGECIESRHDFSAHCINRRHGKFIHPSSLSQPALVPRTAPASGVRYRCGGRTRRPFERSRGP